uniref:Ovule protein n=1 Tax=Caenorhabditis tropicalis TaxID=1561998 RepID=A0A1I7TBZ8_9PELO
MRVPHLFNLIAFIQDDSSPPSTLSLHFLFLRSLSFDHLLHQKPIPSSFPFLIARMPEDEKSREDVICIETSSYSVFVVSDSYWDTSC